MSDILDNILEGIPKPEEVPPVQTPEQKKAKPTMQYSDDFEKAYGKKA